MSSGFPSKPAPVAALPKQQKTFTANGTFTVPAGVTEVFVTLVGGGTGGSKAYNSGTGAIGGGGGEVYNRWPVKVNPSDVIAITIGLGGARGSTAGAAQSGSSGGSSSFGSYLTALGGTGNTGGGNVPSTSATIPAGKDGVGSGIHSAGGNGGYGAAASGNTIPNHGGCTPFAAGGAGSTANGKGGAGGGSYNAGAAAGATTAPTGYGGGGAGSIGTSDTSDNYGSDGAPGVCVVEWYGGAA